MLWIVSVKLVASLWRGRVDRDGYRDQIVTRLYTQCDVGVSLLSKTHPQFMEHSNGSGLFPVLFLQSLYVPF